MALPQFLLKSVPKQKNIRRLRGLLGNDHLHTVCEAARCPNIGECFSQKTLSFMILGDVCTRHCRFCAVNKGEPCRPDPSEPEQLVAAAQKLGLSYVVVTSVTRDDLADGGASQFAQVIRAFRQALPRVKVEVLIPDFQGDETALQTVLAAQPFVLNHNVETVPRLYPDIRPQAAYQRSLALLRRAKHIKERIYTKSGFMVGLGESRDEVFQVVKDLGAAGCDIVTIGQYLAPTKDQAKVARYVAPEEFAQYRSYGEKIGLRVAAGPFIRSSYHAREVAAELQ